ncbi:MAG: alpha/beta fold hydrolase [Pseudomonadota bacterium]
MNAPNAPLRPDVEDISFSADIAMLSGKLYRAARPKAAAVIHGATGVPAHYYGYFAAWLAEQGVMCLTYDYRDFGISSQGHPHASDATLADWGLRDQPAAQDLLERLAPGVPIWVIGHSIGGLMVPFHANAARIDRLITVASGPIHTSDLSLRWKALSAMLWYGPGAVLTQVLGYLPGRMLGLGTDLPSGVFWQWRRWCTTRGFWLSEIGARLPMPDCRSFRGHLRCVAIGDDGMVPPAAVWRLMQLYPEAAKQQAIVRPDGRAIGHIAVFSREHAQHWPSLIGTA